MKTTLIAVLTLISLSCAATEFKLLHYNIKELNSAKIKDIDAQLASVREIIKSKDFDILSLNEIQYDLPGVPNSSYTSEGENLEKLRALFGLPYFWKTTFFPGNTGLNAKTDSNGNYVLDPNSPGARALADQINFGTVPGQYSSGAIHRFKKKSVVQINKLTWKEFNPSIDLNKFKTPQGKAFPEDMELFDKNFTDIVMQFNGKELHVVLLHTVPSFGFGNPNTPNYERNRDQLRFLEWYLTGETDIDVNLEGIDSIAGESFIAVGDFNVAPNVNAPGSSVLQSILKKTTPWIEQEEMNFTNEGHGYAPSPFRLMLDYIVVSKNIKVIDAEIVHPSFQRIELGCEGSFSNDARPNMVLKTYKKGRQTCSVLVSKEYETFKNASDHYPVWGHFQIK